MMIKILMKSLKHLYKVKIFAQNPNICNPDFHTVSSSNKAFYYIEDRKNLRYLRNEVCKKD